MRCCSTAISLSAGVSLLAMTAASPAFSAVLEAASRVDNVTVYPDAAQVTRIAEVELPAGATSLVIKGLPMTLDPASLRVEGSGGAAIQIGSVETRVAPVETKPADASLNEKLRALIAQRDITRGRIAALDSKKAMIERYAQATPEKLGEKSAPLDVAKWSTAWDAVGQALEQLAEEAQTVRQRLAQIEQEIRALQMSNRTPSANARPSREVTVDLEAATATKSRLLVTYRVRGAGWQPIYDARLTTAGNAKPALQLVRRASISQRTGEDWTNVSVAVSTVRASRGTQAQEVFTQRVRIYQPPPPVAYSRAAPRPATMPGNQLGGRAEMAPAPMAADAQKARAERVREVEAIIEGGDYEAQFRIPGRVDIPTDGSARALRIGTQDMEPNLVVRSSPSIDATAYLEAAFVNKEEAPILPGQVNIQRDGMFIGRGFFRMIAPGEDGKLGFGADDRVKVVRAPVSRREATPGWLGSNKSERQDYRTTITNLHTFPVKVVVNDRIPVSEDTSIVIEPLSTNTAPTEKIVEQRRGVLGWTFDLQPNAKKEIRLGWTIRWPKEKRLVTDIVPENATR